MTPRLPALLSDVREGLEITVRRLDGFQGLVADLVRRAGAEREPQTIERVQEIDALVQRLTRLAAIAQALAAAAPRAEVVLPPATLKALADLARKPATDAAPENADCDIF
ncbi:hypothetical protein [Phenylobacterium sp.]|jgi:hypothetical protein|uniref:hypothetical protein n=1 Tax=Phenylobacterium sp. TaxID=1871053 RepID=UPI002F3E695D